MLDNPIFCKTILYVFNSEFCIIAVEYMPLSLNLKISICIEFNLFKAPKGLMKSSEGIQFKF